MLNINRLIPTVAALVLSFGMVGCGQLGPLFGKPQVRSAQTNEVVFIGDSIFASSGKIQQQIEKRADTTFRTYSIPGAQLVGGFLADSIPKQLDMAFADDPNVRIVVADAGGNDVLIPSIALDPFQCKSRWYRKNLSQKCKELFDNLYVEGVDLINSAGDRGVEKAYLMGYYYVKDGFFKLDSLERAVDYSSLVFWMTCKNSTTDCTYIDTRPVITDKDILWDGIHPNSSGAIKIGDAIWEAGLKDDI